ncbi:MAG TPA: GAF domain-containing protein, partial [Ktedonobacterales bacterium]
ISQGWTGLRRWFLSYAFSPRWLPERWRHSLVGYVVGILLVAAAIGFDMFIFLFFPNFDVPGLLVMLAILLTALGWGAGPSLAATLAGVALMDYFGFTPRFTFVKHLATLLTDDVLFVLVGIIISVIAMQVQRARHRAEAWAASIATERARSELERQRLETVLDVLPVGVAIADAQGRLLEVNKTFHALWGEGAPLLATIAEYGQYKGWWPATGKPVADAEWGLARALTSGEVCSGEEVEIETVDEQRKVIINTAAPIRDEAGTIVGGVAALVDITARKADEQQLARLLDHEQTLRAAAEKTAERWRVLQIISETALSPQALDELLQNLLDHTAAALSIENCAILLLDETGQTLRIHAVHGLEAHLAAEVRIPLGAGAAGRVAATRETLIINDLSTVETVYSYFQERFRSFVGAPLVIDGEVIGAIHMTSAQLHYFTADDARLLELLASRIALVIDRARLYEAERRAHADAEARASQLEAIFEALADGLIAYDADGRILSINAAARYLLEPSKASLTFEGLAPADWRDLLALRDERGQIISGDDLPVRRALRGEVLTGDSAQELVMRRDGQDVLLSVSSTPVRDMGGHIVGAVSIMRDVTERRLLERRTQEALSGLLLIAQTLMQAPDEPSLEEEQPGASPIARRLAELTTQILGCQRLGIFSFDAATDTLSPVALVGPLPEDEPLWQLESLSLRSDDALRAEFLTRLLEGKSLVWDMTRPPLSARPDPFRIRTALVVPMRLREHLVGALFLDYGATDHTYTLNELSLAEGSAMLAALVLERERLLREREEAQASALALRAAYRQIDEFLGLASHELRTPLTSILLGLQLSRRRYERLLQENLAVSEQLAWRLNSVFDQLVLTERQANRLDRLVHDLLDVSRIQRGELSIQHQTVDLAVILAEVVEEQRQAAPERRITLHLPPGQRVLLSVDPERIGQVVTNYLTNALKYSAEDQPVEVGLELEAAAARVWVRDYGPGLPPEEQARVWERFHRVPGIEVQSGSGVGLGLGLHISRMIVKAHHGQVGVQSAPGAGTTFWFTLPLAPID